VGVVEPAEVVPLRPGVLYANVMPSHVAAVRLLPTAGSIYAGRWPTAGSKIYAN
jgi:hypothetical protein